MLCDPTPESDDELSYSCRWNINGGPDDSVLASSSLSGANDVSCATGAVLTLSSPSDSEDEVDVTDEVLRKWLSNSGGGSSVHWLVSSVSVVSVHFAS